MTSATTSSQLNPERDEYLPTAIDEAGEKKVNLDGALQGDREYRIHTFTLPDRGQRLFMMATECAKELNYRDSYLLFNKNKSLYKVIATQPEKEKLIDLGLLSYSFRSRQIAIVSARSIFREFGAKVVKNGYRVRDDYWEQKAIEAGYTDNDRVVIELKRYGAAANASNNTNTSHHHHNNHHHHTESTRSVQLRDLSVSGGNTFKHGNATTTTSTGYPHPAGGGFGSMPLVPPPLGNTFNPVLCIFTKNSAAAPKDAFLPGSDVTGVFEFQDHASLSSILIANNKKLSSEIVTPVGVGRASSKALSNKLALYVNSAERAQIVETCQGTHNFSHYLNKQRLTRNALWDKFWKPKSLAQLEYDIDALEDNRKRQKLYHKEVEERKTKIEEAELEYEKRQQKRAEKAERQAKRELERNAKKEEDNNNDNNTNDNENGGDGALSLDKKMDGTNDNDSIKDFLNTDAMEDDLFGFIDKKETPKTETDLFMADSDSTNPKPQNQEDSKKSEEDNAPPETEYDSDSESNPETLEEMIEKIPVPHPPSPEPKVRSYLDNGMYNERTPSVVPQGFIRYVVGELEKPAPAPVLLPDHDLALQPYIPSRRRPMVSNALKEHMPSSQYQQQQQPPKGQVSGQSGIPESAMVGQNSANVPVKQQHNIDKMRGARQPSVGGRAGNNNNNDNTNISNKNIHMPGNAGGNVGGSNQFNTNTNTNTNSSSSGSGSSNGSVGGASVAGLTPLELQAKIQAAQQVARSQQQTNGNNQQHQQQHMAANQHNSVGQSPVANMNTQTIQGNSSNAHQNQHQNQNQGQGQTLNQHHSSPQMNQQQQYSLPQMNQQQQQVQQQQQQAQAPPDSQTQQRIQQARAQALTALAAQHGISAQQLQSLNPQQLQAFYTALQQKQQAQQQQQVQQQQQAQQQVQQAQQQAQQRQQAQHQLNSGNNNSFTMDSNSSGNNGGSNGGSGNNVGNSNGNPNSNTQIPQQYTGIPPNSNPQLINALIQQRRQQQQQQAQQQQQQQQGQQQQGNMPWNNGNGGF